MQDDNPGTIQLRFYIYGLLHQNPEQSILIPSSYRLAEQFGLSRGAVRYELERLAIAGLIITKHRIGTFTNPQSIYAQNALLDEKMPLIGVLYSSGDFYSYAEYAAKSIAALYTELSEANCYIHDLRLGQQSIEARVTDISARGLDGLIIAGYWNYGEFAREFTEKLNQIALPIVTFGLLDAHFSGVAPDFSQSARELSEICQREKRENIVILSLGQKNQEFVDTFVQAQGNSSKIIILSNDQAEVGVIFQSAKEYLADNNQVDCVICDNTFAKAIPTLLKDQQIDLHERCRVAVMCDFNGQQFFTGLVAQNQFKTMAAHAVDLLQKTRLNPARQVEHHFIPTQLRALNIPEIFPKQDSFTVKIIAKEQTKTSAKSANNIVKEGVTMTKSTFKPNAKKTVSAKNFTLVELLVVIAIISILAALLLPTLKQAQDSAMTANCIGNIKQVSSATTLYQSEFNDFYPKAILGYSGEGYSYYWTWAYCDLGYVQPMLFACQINAALSTTTSEANFYRAFATNTVNNNWGWQYGAYGLNTGDMGGRERDTNGPRLKASQVVNPGRFIVTAESRSSRVSNGGSGTKAYPIHNNLSAVNLSFGDGHAETIPAPAPGDVASSQTIWYSAAGEFKTHKIANNLWTYDGKVRSTSDRLN